jgi:transcription initiation factor TFIIE subunit alpha
VEEDEDIKPNVEYLNSLNDYRKRTRSEEESESVEERTRKVAKTAVDEALFGGDHPEDNVEDGSAPPDDDPIVYGTLRQYS